ncbi:MAG: tetratricopeptide repeat protein [Gemmatimonadota bacterium]
MKSYQQLFAELKRRRVFRVMAVYGVVGFVVLQIVDLAVPALLLPEWTYRFVALILLLGLPVAVVLAWALEVTPDGVRRTGEAAPGELAEIIAAPASKRWPSGVLALLGIVALVGSGWWIGRRSVVDDTDGASAEVAGAAAVPAEADDRPSIAVFPFADMSPQGDQEYFSDGITEELLNALANVRELKVAARTSAFAFKGRDLTAEQLGDTLRVAYLVEGSVRKAENQLRITAQLIDTSDGSHLWSDQYDRELRDVFAIQTEIAEAIADELRVPLGLDDARDLVSPTASLEAYDLYLAGRARMRERGAGVFEAAELFEASIALDSTWAPAWAGLAESRALTPMYADEAGDSVWAESLPEAETAAQRALELDPDNASALVALGNVYRDSWEWAEAEEAYLRALALDPDDVEAHQQYAEYLGFVGRLDEALLEARRALNLDRASIRVNVAAYIAAYNGLYDEAIRLFSAAIDAEPDDPLLGLHYGDRLATYAWAGRWAEVRRELLSGNTGTPAEIERWRSAWPADVERPTPAIVDALADGAWDVSTAMWIHLGRPDRALDLIEASFTVVSFGLTTHLWSPPFESLLGEPRFQAVLRRVGLEGRRPTRVGAE